MITSSLLLSYNIDWILVEKPRIAQFLDYKEIEMKIPAIIVETKPAKPPYEALPDPSSAGAVEGASVGSVYHIVC